MFVYSPNIVIFVFSTYVAPIRKQIPIVDFQILNLQMYGESNISQLQRLNVSRMQAYELD